MLSQNTTHTMNLALNEEVAKFVQSNPGTDPTLFALVAAKNIITNSVPDTEQRNYTIVFNVDVAIERDVHVS